jgi:hypothetical protein
MTSTLYKTKSIGLRKNLNSIKSSITGLINKRTQRTLKPVELNMKLGLIGIQLYKLNAEITLIRRKFNSQVKSIQVPEDTNLPMNISPYLIQSGKKVEVNTNNYPPVRYMDTIVNSLKNIQNRNTALRKNKTMAGKAVNKSQRSASRQMLNLSRLNKMLQNANSLNKLINGPVPTRTPMARSRSANYTSNLSRNINREMKDPIITRSRSANSKNSLLNMRRRSAGM